MAQPHALQRKQTSAVKPSAHFSYRRLSMAELPLLNGLYNAFYRSDRPLAEAVWLYADNPSGNAVIHAAFDPDGQLAGMRPAIPFKLWWRGREHMAYEFADALVDPRHQGQGIFTRLVRMTCDWAERQGCSLYSLPNENSLAVYRRCPGLEVLGDSFTRARPLSLRYLRHRLRHRGDPAGVAPAGRKARALVSGELCLRPVARFESDFADVRAELQQSVSSFTLRTREFLQWRYFGSPVRKYHVALVEERGQLRGYLVLRIVSGIAHVVDIFIRPDAVIARRALGLAARWARDMGAIGIHFSVAGDSFLDSAAARSGYWLKKRSRKLVIDCASRRFLAQCQDRPVDMRDVYFVMGDFDFF